MRTAAALAACALLRATGAPAQAPLTLDDVVRVTLASSAEVRSGEWAVRAQQGALEQARGAFDPQLFARVTTDREKVVSPTQQDPLRLALSDRLAYALGLDRRFRSGLVVSPQLSFTRDDPSALAARNAATASLELALPLLRGRGGGLTAAGERAAATTHRAATHDLRHRRAQSVLRAVGAYWQYAAALRRLAVLRGAEERARRLVDETRTLIAADARPAVDSITVTANLAAKRATRIAGEQGVIAARRSLGLAMGVSADALRALPLPDTLLPPLRPGPDAGPADPAPAVERALRQRADLAAARTRRDAAQGLLRGARRELLPQLDVGVRLGYTGIEGGGELGKLVSPFSNQHGGYFAQLQLSYGLPVGNRLAAGQALQSDAADRQAELAVAELARAIELDAAAAVETLRSALAQLEQSAEAVRLYAAALEGETRKLRLGTSTLFDVIYAEDALTGATLGEIEGRQRALEALAQLRFETGELVAGEAGDRAPVPPLVSWEGAAPR